MKFNDKVLAAFLVSAGMFPATQATQYVASLSVKEKKAMMPITKLAASDVDDATGAVEGSPIPQGVSANLK